MKTKTGQMEKSVRALIIFFMIALVLSGITAFPVETELRWLVDMLSGSNNWLSSWIRLVYAGLKVTNEQYPFIAYGSDWLAFAHLVIAVAFIGPLKDPVKNIWVIEFGMIACAMIFPLALIAGEVRSIPFGWRLIDCAFGALGLIPLAICRYQIKQLEKLKTITS
jgi:hypothetical protein